MSRKQLFSVLVVLCLAIVATAGSALAYDTAELDAKVTASLEEFDGAVANADEIMDKAAGVLVCPKISKVGLGVGLERGLCALQIDGTTVEYYKAWSASYGLTAGIQWHSQLMAFMSEEELAKFRKPGAEWEAGVDGAVSIATVGAGGELTVADLKDPIAVVAWGQKGLMADLSVEGSRYKKIGTVAEVAQYEDPLHRFVVTADVSDAMRRGGQTMQLTVDIEDWVPEEAVGVMEGIIRDEGAVAAKNTLAEMPVCGTIKGGGTDIPVQWARAARVGADQWRVILASAEPMSWAFAEADAAKHEDSVTIIEMDLDSSRVGTGVLQMGPEIGYHDKDGVTVKVRSLNPVKLTSVSYKKID